MAHPVLTGLTDLQLFTFAINRLNEYRMTHKSRTASDVEAALQEYNTRLATPNANVAPTGAIILGQGVTLNRGTGGSFLTSVNGGGEDTCSLT